MTKQIIEYKGSRYEIKGTKLIRQINKNGGTVRWVIHNSALGTNLKKLAETEE